MALRMLLSPFLLLLPPVIAALTPQVTYQHGPLPWSDAASLFLSVDLSTRTASLAVLVNDSSNVAKQSDPNWIGIGISEPTAGSMLGADVVTAEFKKGDLDTCTFTDRHVPFVPFPLTEQPGAFPVPDDCQDDGSWTLVRCERDISTGEMILEVTRPLDAHDTQDRDIVDGPNAVIFAYGGFFQYHVENRGSQRVIFYEGGSPTPDASGTPPLPDDVDGSVAIVATNFTVPANVSTLYACTSKRIDIGKNNPRMIVAVDAVLNASKADMVHHLTVYLCSGMEYAETIKETVPCTGVDNGISGPLGNPKAGCATFVGGYAKGAGRLVLPEEAGILISAEAPYLVIETHYDNVAGVLGNIDASGIRVYYTETLRANEAASFILGDPFVDREGIVQSGFEYEHTCPSNCTMKFSENINIYSSFLHMHTTGREVYTNKFSENQTFLETMHKVNFWSDRFQVYKRFPEPFVVKPGEQLQTTCLYDTSKRPKTKWGLATSDEMCINFVGYWPVQRLPDTKKPVNVCSYVSDGNSLGFTICGDASTIDNTTVLLTRNPNFNDTVGAPTDFGDEVENCTRPDPLLTPSPTSGIIPPDGIEESPDPGESVVPSPSEEEMSPEPTGINPPGDDDDDNVCFPQTATVSLKDGSKKRMDQLAIGDEVEVGVHTFSQVFMFTHKARDVQYSFVRIATEGGVSISLTTGHFLYINGKLEMAKSARVGDFVTLASGAPSMISRITEIGGRGLYNPQTIQGNIVVDGILASTYTTAIEPSTAHGILAPIRWVYDLVGIDASSLVCVA